MSDAQALPHEYAVYDFSETIQALPWPPVKVLAAWGRKSAMGDWDEEWIGGFAVESADGRVAVVVGWCDSTGWGCQDGTRLLCDLPGGPWEPVVDAWVSDDDDFRYEWPYRPGSGLWERDPADLNKWIADGMQSDTIRGGTAAPAWRDR